MPIVEDHVNSHEYAKLQRLHADFAAGLDWAIEHPQTVEQAVVAAQVHIAKTSLPASIAPRAKAILKTFECPSLPIVARYPSKFTNERTVS